MKGVRLLRRAQLLGGHGYCRGTSLRGRLGRAREGGSVRERTLVQCQSPCIGEKLFGKDAERDLLKQKIEAGMAAAYYPTTGIPHS